MIVSILFQIFIIILGLNFFYKLQQRNVKDAFEKVIVIFFVCILLHNVYTLLLALIEKENRFLWVGAPFGLFYGLLFYLGTYTKIYNKFPGKIMMFFHLLPVVVWFMVYFAYIIQNLYADVSRVAVYYSFLYKFIVLNWIFYIICVIFQKKVSYEAWIKRFLIALLFLFIILTLFFLSSILKESKDVYVSSRIVVYGIMLAGAILADRLFITRKETPLSYRDTDIAQIHLEGTSPLIPVEILEEYELRIKKLMEHDKVYLDPEFSLSELSKELKISSYHLSMTFTQQIHENFRTYINKYRVNHACALLKNTSLSIEEVAFDSGFNSKVTFHRQFKKFMSVTPSEYRDKLT